VKFDIGGLCTNICQENPKFGYNPTKIGALYIRPKYGVIVVGKKNRHKSALFRVKWYQTVKVAEEV
jgi:hypothetical protein